MFSSTSLKVSPDLWAWKAKLAAASADKPTISVSFEKVAAISLLNCTEVPNWSFKATCALPHQIQLRRLVHCQHYEMVS